MALHVARLTGLDACPMIAGEAPRVGVSGGGPEPQGTTMLIGGLPATRIVGLAMRCTSAPVWQRGRRAHRISRHPDRHRGRHPDRHRSRHAAGLHQRHQCRCRPARSGQRLRLTVPASAVAVGGQRPAGHSVGFADLSTSGTRTGPDPHRPAHQFAAATPQRAVTGTND
ncbi:hypothetical protein FHY11_003899 [Xanthomonas arboricola]|uniref:hypothetical protein n=1 Tax=Xanthomonas euroxanthea TaxID=2259622 RepID=UPI00141AC17A|nr:hypothetical protein [Xanthomonas euroxanthea]NIK10346.1 hypothetical protein [Xanthomonas euroxanthea]